MFDNFLLDEIVYDAANSYTYPNPAALTLAQPVIVVSIPKDVFLSTLALSLNPKNPIPTYDYSIGLSPISLSLAQLNPFYSWWSKEKVHSSIWIKEEIHN